MRRASNSCSSRRSPADSSAPAGPIHRPSRIGTHTRTGSRTHASAGGSIAHARGGIRHRTARASNRCDAGPDHRAASRQPGPGADNGGLGDPRAGGTHASQAEHSWQQQLAHRNNREIPSGTRTAPACILKWLGRHTVDLVVPPAPRHLCTKPLSPESPWRLSTPGLHRLSQTPPAGSTAGSKPNAAAPNTPSLPSARGC